jgi:hypothetical protein
MADREAKHAEPEPAHQARKHSSDTAPLRSTGRHRAPPRKPYAGRFPAAATEVDQILRDTFRSVGGSTSSSARQRPMTTIKAAFAR